jgi:hypothetical protein
VNDAAERRLFEIEMIYPVRARPAVEGLPPGDQARALFAGSASASASRHSSVTTLPSSTVSARRPRFNSKRPYGSAAGTDTLIVGDAGGTTFDVSLVRNRRIPRTRETWLGKPLVSHMTGMASVDVRSIGGGSIVSVIGRPRGAMRRWPASPLRSISREAVRRFC